MFAAAPLAIGSMAAAGAGGILGAIGSKFSGQASSNMYNYQAGIAAQNSMLASQDANYALSAGEVETQQIGMKGREQIGQTKAGFGASNVDVNSGSSSRVISSETEINQQNEAISNANASKRAFGFSVKAAMDTAQGNIYTSAAQTSQTAGTIGAISSVIGGAGNVASKWLQFGQSFGNTSGGNSSAPNYFGNTGGDSSSWYGS